MSLPIEQSYRAFLLGLSDPVADRRTEESILEGSLSAEDLLQAEDELIDDYLFGRLNPIEEEKFNAHFLVSGERSERLNLARALMQHASSQPAEARAVQTETRLTSVRLLLLGWRIPIMTGAAAAALALAWLVAQDLRLSRDLEKARKASGEAHQLLAQNSADTQVRVELFPGQTRGIGRTPAVRLPNGAGQLWIIIHPSTQLAGKFRVELVGDDESEIWAEEFAHPLSGVAGEISISIPAALLARGDYWLRLEEPSTGGKLVEVETYSFRVDIDPVRRSPSQ